MNKWHQNLRHDYNEDRHVWNEDKLRDLILILFKTEQNHQHLKHDCSEDKVGDLILVLSEPIIINLAFTW